MHLDLGISAVSVPILLEGQWPSFGSLTTDDIMAPIQFLASCAAIVSVLILYMSHSRVRDDGVSPGLGILARICFLN